MLSKKSTAKTGPAAFVIRAELRSASSMHRARDGTSLSKIAAIVVKGTMIKPKRRRRMGNAGFRREDWKVADPKT